ncbi:hypothetical protein VHEMI08446 [[Torrubiella] hemipterigena]|uniref:2EXR domain-containing protein n=1 Tax=[Torrubiella] hemipterigena TaxID=1531966 RepID=A0A0A1T6S5_9HYPO|nr:hypothetical protein VHEMI08446 [[Torrubiella] hemipterigena]
MAFHQFGLLPAKVRQRIWQLTVAEDEREICLLWPTNLDIGYKNSQVLERLPLFPLTVDTAFPTAMHVCRESRATMQSASSGVRFRASAAAQCSVPFRAYHPALDTLYVGRDSMHLLNMPTMFEASSGVHPTPEQVSAMQPWFDTLKQAKSIAIEGPYLASKIENLMDISWASLKASGQDNPPPHPITIEYVVASSQFDESVAMRYLNFKQPGRRCKLVPLSPEALDRVRIYPTPLGDRDGDPVPVPQAIAGAREIACDYYGVMQGEEDYRNSLEINPCTFVERQPDGTWRECCQERTYKPLNDNFELFGSGPPVQLQDRPDPEVVRIHDVDIAFEPWMDPHTAMPRGPL